MGRYDHQEVDRVLSAVDVVVVPSIWYENAPLVIGEAFLAGKPVVMAVFGGMQEWVEDEVNGLLFRQRDVDDLRRKLARFIADPGLVGRPARNCPAVKSIDRDAWGMEERYRALVRKAA
jgi:glycosyltransferase involved in cell wall biosynthesis